MCSLNACKDHLFQGYVTSFFSRRNHLTEPFTGKEELELFKAFGSCNCLQPSTDSKQAAETDLDHKCSDRIQQIKILEINLTILKSVTKF